MPLMSGRSRSVRWTWPVTVCVCVLGPVNVAALVNGNDTLVVIDAVSEHAT